MVTENSTPTEDLEVPQPATAALVTGGTEQAAPTAEETKLHCISCGGQHRSPWDPCPKCGEIHHPDNPCGPEVKASVTP